MAVLQFDKYNLKSI